MTQHNGYLFGEDAQMLMRVCENIRFAEIPDGVTSIHASALGNNVKAVHIPASVTAIEGGPVLRGDSLVYITVAEDNPVFCEVNGILYSKDKRTLLCYPASMPGKSFAIPDHVECISDCAFASAQYLEEVYIPASVREIKWTPFSDCQMLRYIHVAEDNPYFCSEDGVLFRKPMEQLIQYPIAKVGEKYEMPYQVRMIAAEAFAGNPHLRDIFFPDGILSIGKCACAEMKNLEHVCLPAGLEYIANQAFCCMTTASKLSNVSIPDEVDRIGDWAFSGVQHIEYHGTATGAPWGAKSIN